MIDYHGKKYNCPMELAVGLISGKWKAVILWHLSDGALRFSELCRRFPEVSEKVLTAQLRSLEDDGIITRTVFLEVPPRVEYALTDLGRGIIPILEALCRFGKEFEARFGVEPAEATPAAAAPAAGGR